MKKRIFLLTILALAILVLFASCHPGHERYTVEDPAGFFWGVWHGLISIFTLIGSIFSDTVTIYESHNTGFFYNLGFLIGVGSPIGSISLFKN